jgi:hypothetical protein
MTGFSRKGYFRGVHRERSRFRSTGFDSHVGAGCVVVVRARVDDAVGRITLGAEERTAGIVAEGELEDPHPRKSAIIAELIDFVASIPPCAFIVFRPGVEP